MTALVKTVQQHYPKFRVKVLFASLKDKDNQSIFKMLSELTNKAVVTSFEHYRAIDAPPLSKFAPEGMACEIDTDWIHAYKRLLKSMKSEELLLVTGSLYFITEVRKYLKSVNSIQ